MFKFISKKLIESQLKKLPKEQRELIMALMEKDPKLFETIAKEIKVMTKNGMDEQLASMNVMMRYKPQIQKIMLDIQKGR
jgi:ABC-type dipeptide/oligopeptide/nickel transport system ATPase subunit